MGSRGIKILQRWVNYSTMEHSMGIILGISHELSRGVPWDGPLDFPWETDITPWNIIPWDLPFPMGLAMGHAGKPIYMTPWDISRHTGLPMGNPDVSSGGKNQVSLGGYIPRDHRGFQWIS